MKKKKKISFALLITLTTMSCNKKNIIPTSKNEFPSSITYETTRPIQNSYRIFHWNGGNPYCDSEGGNCLPDVVVTPKILDHISIISNFIDKNDNEGLRHYLYDNMSEISEFIDRDLIQDYLNGHCILVKAGDVRTNFFIIFANPNYDPENPETIQFVYPFINR